MIHAIGSFSIQYGEAIFACQDVLYLVSKQDNGLRRLFIFEDQALAYTTILKSVKPVTVVLGWIALRQTKAPLVEAIVN